MNREKRLQTLEEKAVNKIYQELCQGKVPNLGRSEAEKDFFAVHGFFPATANLNGRTERSFVVHGLKTTIILEPAKPYEMLRENKGR